MPGSAGTVWQLLGMLFVVILILVAAWLATRWIASRGISGGYSSSKTGGSFSVVAQLPVGRNERLLVVRMGGSCLLLGVTQESVTLLKELTDEETAEWLKEPEARPTFLEALQENLRKKK